MGIEGRARFSLAHPCRLPSSVSNSILNYGTGSPDLGQKTVRSASDIRRAPPHARGTAVAQVTAGPTIRLQSIGKREEPPLIALATAWNQDGSGDLSDEKERPAGRRLQYGP